ncbi:hypothetical protein GGS24DRAFT_487427 [Hypoxylon argillaceum]|nr:hypothetical protein GGS24DRAFT_487427 [Hypoxylon argillaceum]
MTRLMPLDFNIYSESATSGDVYFMGPHQKDRQFALTFHSNSFAQIPNPFLILHDGLTRQDRAIGTATNAWVKGHQKFFDEFIITAPPLAGAGSPLVQEPLVAVHKGTYWRPVTVMRYSVQVAAAAARNSSSGGESERQEFEWQECNSGEALGLPVGTLGWRLVALADDSETLAVCVRHSGSLTKFLRFAFKGKGRTAGHYGLTWEVMAILTGLTTWSRMLEIDRSMG